MADETEKANGKTERLGIIPAEKIPAVVGAKVWAEHRKNLAAREGAKARRTRDPEFLG